MGPGRTVGGRYRIIEKIGHGGHGEVHRAQQLPLGRDVALKVLLPEAYAGEGPERFVREASLVQTLDHPNTVRLFDFGVDEGGFPYMAFELLRGTTLEGEITKGPLPPERVARIASQVLKALMDAHARGIIHRDIKPSNVFLVDFAGEKDFVKVLDFGVARRAVESTAQPKITSDGEIVGTPAYMAPEQVKDEPIGPPTDLYSLGLVMAEALTSEMVVFGKSQPEIWIKQASPKPVELSPRVLASALGPVIVRATNKNPGDRFASAEEMLHAVEQAMKTGSAETNPLAAPMTVRMPPPPPTPRPTPSRPPVTTPSQPTVRAPSPPVMVAPRAMPTSRWPVIVAAIAAVGLVIGIVGQFVLSQRAINPRIPYSAPAMIEAPPLPPVVETVMARGWVFNPPPTPLVQSDTMSMGFSFVKRDPNMRIFYVLVIDFLTEDLAIAMVENDRLHGDKKKIVRRKAKRVIVIDVNDDKAGDGPAVADQLLP